MEMQLVDDGGTQAVRRVAYNNVCHAYRYLSTSFLPIITIQYSTDHHNNTDHRNRTDPRTDRIASVERTDHHNHTDPRIDRIESVERTDHCNHTDHRYSTNRLMNDGRIV